MPPNPTARALGIRLGVKGGVLKQTGSLPPRQPGTPAAIQGRLKQVKGFPDLGTGWGPSLTKQVLVWCGGTVEGVLRWMYVWDHTPWVFAHVSVWVCECV